DAGEIDVHAAVILVGPEQAYLEVGIGGVQAAEIVGVDDAHVALAGVDGVDHRVVVGEHVGGQVVHPAAENLFGLLLAVGFQQGGGQRLVVDLLAGTQAQATFPVLVGQRLVGAQLVGLDALGAVDDGPRTQRQAGPGPGGGAILRGNVGGHHVGLQ